MTEIEQIQHCVQCGCELEDDKEEAMSTCWSCVADNEYRDYLAHLDE